ncbi:protein REDUCED WALL ACETYLATION 3-like [Iris pallida]|uniref:Protein REDUCED WALL ACETYLATION 3-like n=1 Tax=Iris pallida TaxID=29817 RepID=A0AAX6DM30_IRIPA|nr:protein REDUCED WALL ACETYLATION 3-like [Iris pallida]KAJ6831807.1 protein REDUCED WALL ACETYLATION 3-like [Iris pallida]
MKRGGGGGGGGGPVDVQDPPAAEAGHHGPRPPQARPGPPRGQDRRRDLPGAPRLQPLQHGQHRRMDGGARIPLPHRPGPHEPTPPRVLPHRLVICGMSISTS